MPVNASAAISLSHAPGAGRKREAAAASRTTHGFSSWYPQGWGRLPYAPSLPQDHRVKSQCDYRLALATGHACPAAEMLEVRAVPSPDLQASK